MDIIALAIKILQEHFVKQVRLYLCLYLSKESVKFSLFVIIISEISPCKDQKINCNFGVCEDIGTDFK